jgi:PadR family transcriptional regulator PadR
MINEEKFSGIKKGFLELVVMKVISRHKVYAADILAKLDKTPFSTQEGTLYPLLSKLKRDGSVEYEWVESDLGPPRKYYSLTKAGSAALESRVIYLQNFYKNNKKQ